MVPTTRQAVFLCIAISAGCAHPGRTDLKYVEITEVCDTLRTDSSGAGAVVPELREAAVDEAALVGVIVDQQVGTAIPRALIRLSGPVRRDALSDSAGGFRFRSLPPGRYEVYGARLGHRPTLMPVRLARGRIDTLRISMRYEVCSMRPPEGASRQGIQRS